MILLYSPTPNKKVAEEIGKELLKRKLVACANILGPSTSLYRWKGKNVKETEYILLCKTTKSQSTKAAKLLELLHPYECPCVLTFTASVNTLYENWMKSALR